MGVVKDHHQRHALHRARTLRRDDTLAEARLWNALRARRLGGWTWKRQVPWGPFIPDFLCTDARLVVELDGGQHADQVEYDDRRTAYLQRDGLRVLRFWNSAVLTNRDGVSESILDACGGENSFCSPPAKPKEGEVGRGPAGIAPDGKGEDQRHRSWAMAGRSGGARFHAPALSQPLPLWAAPRGRGGEPPRVSEV